MSILVIEGDATTLEQLVVDICQKDGQDPELIMRVLVTPGLSVRRNWSDFLYQLGCLTMKYIVVKEGS